MFLPKEVPSARTQPLATANLETPTANARQNTRGLSARNEKVSPSETRPKVLLVDDDADDLALSLRSLNKQNCDVVTATSVTEAFKQIATQHFDVLITDLNMPDPGDGFSVITAMRHTQPDALTLVTSDFPDIRRAMSAIALQADDVMLKPFDTSKLADLIERRKNNTPLRVGTKETVASILDGDLSILMRRWLERVMLIKELAAIPVTASDRTRYLPDMIASITARLRSIREIELVDTPLPEAVQHGESRYRQGYTAPLIVQESRILQVSIFETIERNLGDVDFGQVLPDIMIIADEVDSQLKQTIDSFLTMERVETARATSASA